jgi:hypothetical protein
MTHQIKDSALTAALMPLVAIADAYDANELDGEARKFTGGVANDRDPAQIELYTGRGGRRLLTLEHCLAARRAVRSGVDAHIAVTPLVDIANAYDANELDDGARKFWGRDNEHENSEHPEDIELFTGRGGKRLLTLDHALAGRAALNEAFFDAVM